MLDDDDRSMMRLQEGDERAFEELVGRHQSPLIGFFFRHLRDWQLSEDLSQETLLRVHNTSWDYLPRGTFKAWMYRIARNLMIDTTRKRAHDALVRSIRTTNSSDGENLEDVMSRLSSEIMRPDEIADRRELSEIVDELLPKIPEDQRVTFILYIYVGLSLPEIAEAMEANLPTTKSRLRLAREKLRAQLTQRGIVESDGEET